MTALHLRRTDPARNMRRFYRLDCPCRLAAAGRAQEAARLFLN